jgi:hypothetical protein
MATIGPEDREPFARRDPEPERQKSIKAVAGGSITEAICGAATVVLAIIGLAGTLPGYLASIATIVFGVALLAQGSAIAARYSHLLRETMPEGWDARAELSGSMGAELLGGGAGVVLGILGLLGIATATLIPIAIIVFGGALLLGSGAPADLSSMPEPFPPARFAMVARQASVAASGAQVLIGTGAIVLGIIALVGIDTVLVTLVSLLVLGVSTLLSGAAVSSRMAAVMKR